VAKKAIGKPPYRKPAKAAGMVRGIDWKGRAERAEEEVLHLRAALDAAKQELATLRATVAAQTPSADESYLRAVIADRDQALDAVRAELQACKAASADTPPLPNLDEPPEG
jgi:hypothetical protein